MSFLITYEYRSKGQMVSKRMRMDGPDEQEVRARFARMYPRRTLTKIEDVTHFVRAGFACY